MPLLQRCVLLLLPDFCIGCERIGTQLCTNCAQHLCFIDQRHSQALRATTHIQKIWSAVEYRDIAQDIVKAVKYERYWRYTELMTRLMLQSLEPPLREAKIDAFVPVPLAPARRHWRGFNQAEHLAKKLGKHFSIPVETHMLRRTSMKTNQAKLNREQRQNLSHDYEARTPPGTTINNSRTLCLVDDVTTTGATLEACAAALVQAEYTNIVAVTFAAA